MKCLASYTIFIFIIVCWPMKTRCLSHCKASCQFKDSCFSFSKLDKTKDYVQLGEISFGAVLPMTQHGPDAICTGLVHGLAWLVQYVEAIRYATDTINADSNLLPNITLGFAIIDSCSLVNTAVAASLSFLKNPHSTFVSSSSSSGDLDLGKNEYVPSMSVEKHVNGSSDIGDDVSNATSSSNCTQNGDVRSYDVIGILGPTSSVRTVPISYIYRVAQIPILSYMATSDELSDRSTHKYFMRLVPPDTLQVQAIISFIHSMGWSYISVVYSKGAYGENGLDNIKLLAPKYGICIATTHRSSPNTNYTEVVMNLMKYPRARVVVAFTGVSTLTGLYNAEKILNIRGQFIFVGSDGVAERSREFEDWKDQVEGTFTFMYFSKYVPGFRDFMSKLRLKDSRNPWLKDNWEMIGKCSFDDDMNTCGGNDDITQIEGFNLVPSVSLVIDAVYTYAHAVHNLMTDQCPNATGQAARQCITGPLLLDYMMKSDFNGTTGRIRFDSEGSLLAKYKVMQYRVENYTRDFESNRSVDNSDIKGRVFERDIGVYDLSTGEIEYKAPIEWDFLAKAERVIAHGPEEERTNIPESVCSRPCGFGELRIQVDPCCWECRTCRSNERISLHKLSCEPCEDLTWPDPSTELSTCQAIPLSYPAMSDTLPLFLIVLGLLAIGSSLAVFGAYIYLREARVIKAASRELSFLQIGAILIGYVTVLVFQAPPSHVTCSAQYFLFCFSFSLLYAPMLIKAVRIFRIFESGKTHKRPRFVSPLSQIIKSLALTLLQVIICIIVVIIWRPSAVKIQPVRLEKFVELSCDMTLAGLTSFLCYNLVLVTLCSVLAFKTRTLPDNFNESRFTSMCVSTTLVIWLAFVPTYFTATRTAIRALSLSVALLLNHTVALVFLFLPKIYAALYLPEETFATTRFQSSVGNRTRVAPVSELSTRPSTVDQGPVF